MILEESYDVGYNGSNIGAKVVKSGGPNRPLEKSASTSSVYAVEFSR